MNMNSMKYNYHSRDKEGNGMPENNSSYNVGNRTSMNMFFSFFC